ncbi:hypothetical protein JAO75_22665 [Microvirga sp. BT325]|uniref:Uncharacterized protein n=1 Tax=Microvirga splendida TaxID=2795727 RepID=A0ABS0Y7D0_9HYPH|nr:hypothetical protein [Microvirga splendida]
MFKKALLKLAKTLLELKQALLKAGSFERCDPSDLTGTFLGKAGKRLVVFEVWMLRGRWQDITCLMHTEDVFP